MKSTKNVVLKFNDMVYSLKQEQFHREQTTTSGQGITLRKGRSWEPDYNNSCKIIMTGSRITVVAASNVPSVVGTDRTRSSSPTGVTPLPPPGRREGARHGIGTL